MNEQDLNAQHILKPGMWKHVSKTGQRLAPPKILSVSVSGIIVHLVTQAKASEATSFSLTLPTPPHPCRHVYGNDITRALALRFLHSHTLHSSPCPPTSLQPKPPGFPTGTTAVVFYLLQGFNKKVYIFKFLQEKNTITKSTTNDSTGKILSLTHTQHQVQVPYYIKS